MSSNGRRRRRTVPLEESDCEETPDHVRLDLQEQQPQKRNTSTDSLTEASSLHSPLPSIESRSLRSSRRHTPKPTNTGTLNTNELKKSLRAKKKRESRKPTKKSPCQRTTAALTIGNSSGLVSSRNVLGGTGGPLHLGDSQKSCNNASANDLSSGTLQENQLSHMSLPDLVGLEQAFQDCSAAEIHKLMQHEGAGWHNNFSKTPVGWKTPFEVDTPGGASKASALESSIPSPPISFAKMAEVDVDPTLSTEQRVWKGIDELLETGSMDDSFCYSTTDILPRETVLAMRSDRSVSYSHVPELSRVDDTPANRQQRGLDKIESSYERHPGNESLDDGDESESNDRVTELLSNIANGSAKAALTFKHPDTPRSTADPGNLFDVFHWSEKANVDEERQKKTKLNRRRSRHVTLVTNSFHGRSRQEHDDTSLPRLSSFQMDNSPKSPERKLSSTWEDVTDSGFMQSPFETRPTAENMPILAPILSSTDVFFEDADGSGSPLKSSIFSDSTNTSGTIVFDDGVEACLMKLQQKLPTIIEDDNCYSHQTKNLHGSAGRVGFDDTDDDASPTGVAPDEQSPFDELPTLASLSVSPQHHEKEVLRTPRKEEKKERRPSLPNQLFNSIKKMTRKGTPRVKKPTVTRGDEKYFPKQEKQKFGANRCLLAE